MSDNDINELGVINREFDKPTTKKDQQESRVVEELSSQSNNQVTMEVKVASPFTRYYDGQAFSVSAINATGPFDILPKHHNFMSLLQPCNLVIRTANGDEKKLDIAGGLLHVKADKVTVFLDI
ncbi:MAG: hypothetical protein WDN66_04025 [Candidatus Saccharibacteria bacterium]